MNYEIIGIIATSLIVLAFTRNGEKQIRILDLVGAMLFVVYGALIHSFSTILLNGILIGVQVFKLYRMKNDVTATEE